MNALLPRAVAPTKQVAPADPNGVPIVVQSHSYSLICGPFHISNAMSADIGESRFQRIWKAIEPTIGPVQAPPISGANYLLAVLPDGQAIRGTGRIRKLRATAVTGTDIIAKSY